MKATPSEVSAFTRAHGYLHTTQFAVPPLLPFVCDSLCLDPYIMKRA